MSTQQQTAPTDTEPLYAACVIMVKDKERGNRLTWDLFTAAQLYEAGFTRRTLLGHLAAKNLFRYTAIDETDPLFTEAPE